MKPIQQMIEVRVPVHTAYEQLSRFESYPQFMTGVQEVRKLSDTTTHWIMDLDGRRTEFDAQITDCRLDERVAWAATGGTTFSEALTLKPVSANRTQIIAELAADAEALLPSDAHAQESLSRRLKADLDGFKRYVEQLDPAVASGGATGSASRPSPAAMRKTRSAAVGSASVPPMDLRTEDPEGFEESGPASARRPGGGRA